MASDVSLRCRSGEGDEGNRNVSHQTTTTGTHLTSEDVNFLDLDLNLLVALDALLGEQSVTRAAEVLQRSQPALSASLKRLRHQFQDDLLVRVGNHHELTPLGTQLKARLAMVMADVERLFATRARFDAATSTRQFVLYTADYGQQMLGRAIATELAEHAPETRLHFRPLSDVLIAGASDALRNVDGFVAPARVRRGTSAPRRLSGSMGPDGRSRQRPRRRRR